jgi:hypothetical protein
MRGFTSPLWPIRYKPFPDELLSCWLVRLAHGHGLKVQTFCNLMFGNRRQVWNRDIDRLAPAWLVDELILRTGTSPELAWGTTLRAYEGILYPKFRLSGTSRWILALKVYHRTRQGYGLQFCPACLAEDNIPYFRKRWRIALNTVCSKHGTMLFDRCPHCGAAVAFHRLDMAGVEAIDVAPLSYCHSCQFDLREAVPENRLSMTRTHLYYCLMRVVNSITTEHWNPMGFGAICSDASVMQNHDYTIQACAFTRICVRSTRSARHRIDWRICHF